MTPLAEVVVRVCGQAQDASPSGTTPLATGNRGVLDH